MISTTRVFFAIFFYITLCLAETDTYLQIIGPPETINVTINNATINITISNVTNASKCDVLIDVEDLEYDNIQKAFFYYISGEGSFYFQTTLNGNSGTGNNHDSSSFGKDNNDGRRQSRDHNTFCNRGSSRRNNITNYAISPLNFTIGNVTYCVNITITDISGKNSSHYNNHHNTNNNHGEQGHNENDNDRHSPKPHGNEHDDGRSHHEEHDRHHHSPNPEPTSNPTPNPNHAPSSTKVIDINVTIVNNTNDTVIITNTTTNNTAGNITSNVTVIVVPADTNAIGYDPKNQFTYTDQWGNDPRHAQIRDNLLNNRMQIENQLDNEIKNQSFNVERVTDIDITAQNNVIKLTSLFLFPQGASEDAKQDTCDALTNTAESFSNITFTTDCDFTGIPKPPNGQAGDYVLISTYSTSENTNGGMALTWSMLAILIAFLSCNF